MEFIIMQKLIVNSNCHHFLNKQLISDIYTAQMQAFNLRMQHLLSLNLIHHFLVLAPKFEAHRI